MTSRRQRYAPCSRSRAARKWLAMSRMAGICFRTADNVRCVDMGCAKSIWRLRMHEGVSMIDEDYILYEMGVDALKQDRFDDALNHFQASNSIRPHYKTFERLSHLLSKLGQDE